MYCLLKAKSPKFISPFFGLFYVPFFKVVVIPNNLTKNEKNSTMTSPSKWRPKLTIFEHFRTPNGSEMDQVKNSSYQIEPTGGGEEYEHQKAG